MLSKDLVHFSQFLYFVYPSNASLTDGEKNVASGSIERKNTLMDPRKKFIQSSILLPRVFRTSGKLTRVQRRKEENSIQMLRPPEKQKRSHFAYRHFLRGQ